MASEHLPFHPPMSPKLRQISAFHRDRHGTAELVAYRYPVGSPLEPSSAPWPLVELQILASVRAHVRYTKAEGAEIVLLKFAEQWDRHTHDRDFTVSALFNAARWLG